MAAPYYLEAPKGDEYQPTFLDRVGNGISKWWDQTPPEAFFALSRALATPGAPFASKLSMGISGLGEAVAANKKRQGLASAFDQFLPTVPEAYRPVMQQLAKEDPETLMKGIASSVFAKPNEPTSAIQNYEYAKKQGYTGTFNQFQIDLARAGATGQPPVDIPGVGPVDPRTGAPAGAAPSAPPAPPPSPVAPSPFMTDSNATGQTIGGQPGPVSVNDLGGGAPPAPPASAPPPSAPQPYRPILDPQAKMLNLGPAPAGKMWVYGPDNRPTLQSVPGAAPEKPNEAQQKAGQLGQEMMFSGQVLGDQGQLNEFITSMNGAMRAGGNATDFMQSGVAQRFQTAGRQWVTNMLYLKSGAQAGPAEIENNMKIYIPAWGDKPEAIQYKAAARAMAERALLGAVTPEQKAAAKAAVDEITNNLKGSLFGMEPPKEAIQYLRMNPKLKSQFDAKYGPGSADKYLKAAK